MSARRIAVLVGSHDPAYFTSYTQRDGPSEAAVLTALRVQRSSSEAPRRASVTETTRGHGRSIARHAGGRLDVGTRRKQVPDANGPPRTSVFAAAARTRRSTRRPRARILASRTAGA
jgi:hypothetical protein